MRFTALLFHGVMAATLLADTTHAQAPESRASLFDRYLPDALTYEAANVPGEHIDPRTLGVSWSVEDLRIPGNGGLDLVVSRSFGQLAHTPSELGHWYFGVPRIQIPTSPWRGPYDPARAQYSTFFAAWNNLWARTDYGASSVCERAGELVDPYFRASLTNVQRPGILFAAGLQLHIPGEPARILLERLPGATAFPADARYVTTDNWLARCIGPDDERIWGGFEVVSPDGTRYVFDFIQYLVPGDYGLGSTGGWIEMGISRIDDVHGNWIAYDYDLDAGGTGLLERIHASDGREVGFEYHPGSVLGVDVQGSPLALVTAVTYSLNGEQQRVRYDYCDFADLYILGVGCQPVSLAPDGDLPVLTAVTLANGTVTRYSYDPDIYAANVTYDWGGFQFQLDTVTLPTGGIIDYDYEPGFSPFLPETNAPRPRLARRSTRGPDVTPGEWTYTYSLNAHIETTRVSDGQRTDEYEFYEGLGTYEFELARSFGQYTWPDRAPWDYDEVMGRLRRHAVYDGDGVLLRETTYEYGLAPFIGKSWYGSANHGSPTLVLSQVRPLPETLRTITDYTADPAGRAYVRSMPLADRDAYMNPRVLFETGHDGALEDDWQLRRTDFTWHNNTTAWIIGLPTRIQRGDYVAERDYAPDTGLLVRLEQDGVERFFDYHPDGSLRRLSRVNDGITFAAEYDDYRRGVPQFESHPIDPAAGQYATVRRAVNELGDALWQDDADGRRTAFAYDPSGWLARVTPPLNEPVVIDYERGPGYLSGTEQRQGSRVRRVRLDGFGRRVEVHDETALHHYASARDYDHRGRLVFRSYLYDMSDPTDSVAGVQYAYDALDRITLERRTADGSETLYCHRNECNNGDYAQYDGGLENGFVVTDSRGYQSTYEFIALGDPDDRHLTRLVQQATSAAEGDEPTFVVSRFERDAWMQVHAIEQGGAGESAVRREFDYDNQGRVVRERHPEFAERAYTYDPAGQLTEVYDNGALTVRYRYDGLGRLLAGDYSSPDTPDISLTWSHAGRLLSLENAVARFDYDYDGEGQLRSETLTAAGRSLSFDYDYNSLGHRVQLTYPSGLGVDLMPDGFGRPARVGAFASSIDYWPDSRVRSLTYGNDTGLATGRTERRRSAGRQVTGPDEQLLLGLAYEYDALANLTTVSDEAGWLHELSLDYDGLNRLTRADGYWGNGRISYDAIGNLQDLQLGAAQQVYAYDANNRLEKILRDDGSVSQYRYDELGNTVDDGLRQFMFDRAGQLTSSSAQTGTTFRYDALGRRTVTDTREGPIVDFYTLDGQLVYSDRCSIDGFVHEYIYLGRELIARDDQACEQGCHP